MKAVFYFIMIVFTMFLGVLWLQVNSWLFIPYWVVTIILTLLLRDEVKKTR